MRRKFIPALNGGEFFCKSVKIMKINCTFCIINVYHSSYNVHHNNYNDKTVIYFLVLKKYKSINPGGVIALCGWHYYDEMKPNGFYASHFKEITKKQYIKYTAIQ